MPSLCSCSASSPAIWHGILSKYEQPEGFSVLCWLEAVLLSPPAQPVLGQGSSGKAIAPSQQLLAWGGSYLAKQGSSGVTCSVDKMQPKPHLLFIFSPICPCTSGQMQSGMFLHEVHFFFLLPGKAINLFLH